MGGKIEAIWLSKSLSIIVHEWWWMYDMWRRWNLWANMLRSYAKSAICSCSVQGSSVFVPGCAAQGSSVKLKPPDVLLPQQRVETQSWCASPLHISSLSLLFSDFDLSYFNPQSECPCAASGGLKNRMQIRIRIREVFVCPGCLRELRRLTRPWIGTQLFPLAAVLRYT